MTCYKWYKQLYDCKSQTYMMKGRTSRSLIFPDFVSDWKMASLMSNCRNLIMACICLSLTFVTVSSLADYGFGLADTDMDLPAKRLFNQACYACMHDHMDMVSCSRCFSGSGPVPFYGTYGKRSFEDHQTLLSMGTAAREMMKRGPASFLVCRCCMYLESWDCCYSCAFGVSYGKRSMSFTHRMATNKMAKRNYFTSFAGMDGGNGMCSCCEADSFDYVCCATRCSRKR